MAAVQVYAACRRTQSFTNVVEVYIDDPSNPRYLCAAHGGDCTTIALTQALIDAVMFMSFKRAYVFNSLVPLGIDDDRINNPKARELESKMNAFGFSYSARVIPEAQYMSYILDCARSEHALATGLHAATSLIANAAIYPHTPSIPTSMVI